MLGIGSAIGGAISAAGTIFGGIKASQAMKESRERIESLQDKNEDLYNLRYNENATQRADAQRVLSYVQDNIRQRNRQAEATRAVMGGTDASVAASKEANNKALSGAASAIAAEGAQRKDQIEREYLNRDADYEQQLANLDAQRAGQIAQAAQGVASIGGSIASSIGGLEEDKINKMR